MSKPISIGVASETREFAQGIKKGVISPLEDAAKSLDDVERAGDAAGAKLEASFEDAQTATSDFKREQAEAGRETARRWKEAGDDVERSTKGAFEQAADEAQEAADKAGDAARQTSRRWKDAGDDVGDSSKRGFDRAGEGVEEFKNEARQNAQEVAASFDGSAQGIADGFQGLAATALAGFGAIGVAASVATGIGIGLFTRGLEKAEEKAAQLRERVAELTGQFIANREAVRTAEDATSYLEDLATATEKGDDSLVSLNKTAKDAGIELRDLTDILVGTEEQQKDAWREVNRLVTALEAESLATDTSTDAGIQRYAEIGRQITAQSKLRDEIGQAIGVTDDATLRTELYTDVTARLTAEADRAAAAEERSVAAVEAAAQARTAAGDSLQVGIDAAEAAFKDFEDAETGALDPQGYIEGIMKRREATEGFSENVARISEAFGLSQEESQSILDKGLDFAPMLQAITDAGLEQQFVDEVKAGTEAGQRIVDATVFKNDIKIGVDATEYDRWVFNAKNGRIDVPVSPRVAEMQAPANPGRLPRP